MANTGATLLSGAAAQNSISANFAAGDTITVNGTTITFVAAGAAGNQLNITDSIATLAGARSTRSRARRSRPRSPAARSRCIPARPPNLSVTSSNTTAFAALGFTGTVTATRGGGGTIGTGQVIGSDTSTFLERIDRGRRGHGLRRVGHAGEPAIALGQDRQRLARRRPYRYLEPVLPDQSQRDRHAGGVAERQHQLHLLGHGPDVAGDRHITLTNAVVNGVALGSPVINFGTGGLTQFADANGNVQVNQIQQDGFPAGQLQSVAVNNNGRVVGNFSNGQNLDLAEISLSPFNGTNFLKRVDGGAFEVTDESGPAMFGKAGTIGGSSLEGSNTDIADEFTKLIVTQQAYSANTKVITTANTMVQDLLNVLR